MFGLTLTEKALFGLDLLATAVLLLRLWSTGLYKIYSLFFSFIAFSLAQQAFMASLSPRSNLYGWSFLVTESLRMVFFAVILLELYSLVFKELKGIASVAKAYIKWALAASIFISLAIVFVVPLSSDVPSNQSIIHQYFVFHLAISTSLVLFVLLIAGFLVAYPIPLARNVIVYTIGYAVYFLAHAAGFVLLSTGAFDSNWRDNISKVLQCVSLAGLAFWAIFLNQAGETKIRTAVHRFNPEQERLALQKLRAVNDMLARAHKD